MINHPVLFDDKYGDREFNKLFKTKFFFLHMSSFGNLYKINTFSHK